MSCSSEMLQLDILIIMVSLFAFDRPYCLSDISVLGSDCSLSCTIYGRWKATCAEYLMLDSFSLQQMDRSGTLWLDYFGVVVLISNKWLDFETA